MNKIGLFPLGIVLFPGSSYPLYIFEERYKKLINECWEDQKSFGITLLTPKKMSSIGCMTFVTDIMNIKSNGNLEILVTGKNRFKINNIIDGEQPYLVGEVEQYEDLDKEIDENLLYETIELYNEIAMKVKNFKIPQIEIDSIGTYPLPSFFIAQKSGLSLVEKQELLEMRSENSRLKKLKTHLQVLSPLIEKAEGIETLSRNDGYLTL
ncbi:MAG: LON peptidase substrate-binding domain-containing protein [Candidatus Kapaibacteriota bacterium]